MNGSLHDTICAVATPPGEGGIGIVRISGEKAVDLADAVVRLHSGRSLREASSHRLYHADLIDSSSGSRAALSSLAPALPRLDEALVVVMRRPRSFTAEDVVEIQCHGGPLVLRLVCEYLVRLGCRMAEPGEFTKRAFLNGRLDLAQAEAVLDTIQSKTAAGLRLAQEQLRGALSQEVRRLRELLVWMLAHVEAGIDFVEEDITFLENRELLDRLRDIASSVGRLVKTAKEGIVLRHGVTAVIVGRPNVGKSSLMNALVQADRAIVTPVPGTTRDVIEETVNVRGIPVRLLDTAGLHETPDPVEQEGIKRTRRALETAEAVLFVLDGSHPLDDQDLALLAQYPDRKRVVVVNKSDLPLRIDASLLTQGIGTEGAPPVVYVSAQTGTGLDRLRDHLRALLLQADFEPAETAMVASLRHHEALLAAEQALTGAIGSVEQRLSGEFIAMDMRGALDALGRITGETTTDEILDRIFKDFCIGK